MLGYLLDPAIQVQNENGVTIAGARVYVYDSNTSELAETYKDFEGTRNTNPVITDTLGNCTIIAEDGIAYDVVFKDDHDNLLFTKENVSVNQGSSSSGNIQVVAGYGIDVTPSTSAGVQKYEVAIDPTIVETFDNMTQYEAGDNIVITDLSGNRKAIGLNDDVYLSDSTNQSLLNSDEIIFYDNVNQVGSDLNPDGLIVTNNSDTVFTKVEKEQIEIVDDNTPTVDKRLTERNNLLQIDYADYANSAYKTLSATPDDVTIWRHRGSGPAEYSLTGVCTSAQSALAAVMSGDLAPYSAGANINITNHVVSGKDWTSNINSAATNNNWDVTPYSGSLTGGWGIQVSNHTISCVGDVIPYSAGNNIYINNHKIYGHDWTTSISRKIDKVEGGAGSKTNPVYLTSANVVTPCFTGSVKLANTVPNYFSADAGSNIMMYAPVGSHKTGDSIKDSIFITNYDNYLTPNTTDKFDGCVILGKSYTYSPKNAGTCNFTSNILIGRNSMSDAQDGSDDNTIIGTNNDLIGGRGATSHKFYTSTVVGYENNIYTDSHATTIVGCYNDVGNYGETDTDNKSVQISILGENNEFKYDPTSANPYDNLIAGNRNKVYSRGDYRSLVIGFDNNLTGNNTYLFGQDLSAKNEGSYEDKVMKVGFGSCHLEIHSIGTVYIVVNGSKIQLN